jgi:hypothetical protein
MSTTRPPTAAIRNKMVLPTSAISPTYSMRSRRSLDADMNKLLMKDIRKHNIFGPSRFEKQLSMLSIRFLRRDGDRATLEQTYQQAFTFTCAAFGDSSGSFSSVHQCRIRASPRPIRRRHVSDRLFFFQQYVGSQHKRGV